MTLCPGRDKDGYYWLTGRVDDVINVSGHRIGTAEVRLEPMARLRDVLTPRGSGGEQAGRARGLHGGCGGRVPSSCERRRDLCLRHPERRSGCANAQLLADASTGVEPCDRIRQELKNKVRKEIGAFAQPDIIHWAPGLPKTRRLTVRVSSEGGVMGDGSGKIMRRILRKIAAGQTMVDDLGDVR